MAQTDIRTGITGFIQDATELKDLYPLFPDCGYVELPFKRTSDYEALKLVPYNANDNWTKGSVPKFIDLANQGQSFVERGTKPQFNKIYEVTEYNQIGLNNNNFEIRRNDTVLQIVNNEGTVVKYFYTNDFKDRVIPKKLLLFIQGAGASGAGGGIVSGQPFGGGSGAAASILINLPNYEGTVKYNGKFVPLRSYWQIYMGKGATGTTSYGQSGETTSLFLRTYKIVDGRYPVDPQTPVIINIPGGMCNEGAGISLTTTYFNPLPGPQNTHYFLINHIKDGVTTLPYQNGNDGGVYNERGYPHEGYAVDFAATNVLGDQQGINKTVFLVTKGGVSRSGQINRGGGGGSSILSSGGYGGYITGAASLPGESGKCGAGGGGGSKNGSEVTKGGNGGDAAVYFYY